MIETERLRLRRPEPSDVAAIEEFVADDEVQRWVGGNPGETAADVVERWMRRWERNGIGQFVVERDGQVIGRVGFLIWDTRIWETSTPQLAGDHAEIELGWAILSRCWGNGYAVEAAHAARGWAYREHGLERVISMIDPRNVRSIRVADKLGCEPEKLVPTPHGPAVVWVHPR